MSSELRKQKMLRDILVVPSSILYKDFGSERPGFIAYDEVNFEEIILEHFAYKPRGKMEEDLTYQQPIPYVLIHNPKVNAFIVYQRGGVDSAAGDKRLFGRWSMGVGGHVEREQEGEDNPIYTTIFKEIEEEIGIRDISNVRTLGYIVDDSDAIAMYHIGILYVVETTAQEVQIGDGELARVVFKTPQEIDVLMTDEDVEMESWSRIARKAYKKIKR